MNGAPSGQIVEVGADVLGVGIDYEASKLVVVGPEPPIPSFKRGVNVAAMDLPRLP
jgi:hypothetical protein